MSTISLAHGMHRYYKDWGAGQPVFCHGYQRAHGLTDTHKERLNADLLAFLRGAKREDTSLTLPLVPRLESNCLRVAIRRTSPENTYST
jgi:hypothetical protein